MPSSLRAGLRGRKRLIPLTLLLSPAVALALAAPASAAAPPFKGSYTISSTVGSFVGSGHLISNPAGDDDSVYTVATPFPLKVFGTTVSTISVSTNGNIQFVSSGASAALTNDALPTMALRTPALAVYWDDLLYGPVSGQEGVFAKAVGSGANRKFVVAWRGHRFDEGSANNTIRVEAVFTPNSPTIQLNYLGSSISNPSATVGIQRAANVNGTTQWTFDGSRPLTAGDRLTLSFHASR